LSHHWILTESFHSFETSTGIPQTRMDRQRLSYRAQVPPLDNNKSPHPLTHSKNHRCVTPPTNPSSPPHTKSPPQFPTSPKPKTFVYQRPRPLSYTKSRSTSLHNAPIVHGFIDYTLETHPPLPYQKTFGKYLLNQLAKIIQAQSAQWPQYRDMRTIR